MSSSVSWRKPIPTALSTRFSPLMCPSETVSSTINAVFFLIIVMTTIFIMSKSQSRVLQFPGLLFDSFSLPLFSLAFMSEIGI